MPVGARVVRFMRKRYSYNYRFQGRFPTSRPEAVYTCSDTCVIHANAGATHEEPIRGIFTPNIVPLNLDGSINELELRRYVDWLIDKGVHACTPTARPASSPDSRPRNAADHSDRLRAECRPSAGAGRGRRVKYPRDHPCV